MERTKVAKSGFILRAVKCEKCKDLIIHPKDISEYERFNCLKGKTYSVKLRLVGNSHAISIPKEIVDFIKEQEKVMNDMVRLCFEDRGRLSVRFGE